MARKRIRTRHPGVKVTRLGRRGGEWVGRWRDPVTRRWRQVRLARLGATGPGAREAWARAQYEQLVVARRERRSREATGEPSAGRNEPLEAALHRALGEVKTEKRSATHRAYRNSARVFLEWANLTGIGTTQELSEEALSRYRGWLVTVRRARVPVAGGPAGGRADSSRPLSAGGVNNYLGGLRALLIKRLAPRGLLPYPARQAGPILNGVLAPCAVDQRPVRILTRQEIAAILEAARADSLPGAARFVASALLAGARVNELQQFETSFVDLETGVLRLPGRICKSRRGRLIELERTPSLAPILLGGGPGRCFAGINEITGQRLLERLKRRSKIRFGWHGLRRACGSYIANASWGGPRKAAQQLGHGLALGEARYQRQVVVPPEAATLEQAMGCEVLFRAIADSPAARRALAEAEKILPTLDPQC